MSNNKKLVEAITPMNEDFSKWYTDVIKKAELVEYSGVRGCMILEPYGFAIWENIQKGLDKRLKETGHSNVYMPMFIPESLLQKEKDHVEGFAPEVAWVTHGGAEKLTERLCIRPTSETLFCEYYANTIRSYRDLPKLNNQWCSVVRWEKTTRPFLRTMEFLWQEGHTAHKDAKDAQDETLLMLKIYADFCTEELAIPVISGKKTDKEKFAGANATYTIESLMHDGKVLQSGTSHNFGDGFARAFGIQYSDENNEMQFVHQTSWGMSTRIIGAVIMVHGDDSGLKLPPKIAPQQLVIVPVAQHKEGVLEAARAYYEKLAKVCRVTLDDTDKKPGWKFSEYEMRGVPLRMELGPKDIEANQCVLARRDNGEKIIVSLDDIENTVLNTLADIQENMYKTAAERLRNNIKTASSYEEFCDLVKTGGFIRAEWCGDGKCEDSIKEATGATSRCIPFDDKAVTGKCICCGKDADTVVYWGLAY